MEQMNFSSSGGIVSSWREHLEGIDSKALPFLPM
jgi:hypothetical protein